MSNRLIILTTLLLLCSPYVGLTQQKADSVRSSENQLIDGKTAYIQGLNEFENKNYEKALDLLSAAYIKLPGHSGISFALADTYLKLGDLTNAAYYGKQAAKLEPKNKWYHLKLAEIYRASGKNQAVIDELETALRYHPNATNILTELARTYASQGDYLKSNNVYNQLLHLMGDDIGTHLQKLKNFSELHMRDSAVVELQTIRRLDPDNLSTLQLLSSYYLQMNKKKQAKEVLTHALNRNKRDPKTLIMLADIYVEEAKWDTASTLLNSVVSDPLIHPQEKLTVTQYLLSRFKQEPNNPELQKTVGSLISTFIKADPDFGRAHAIAADFFNRTGQTDKALAALKTTNSLDPTNDTAWRQRLQLLLSEKKYKEAIDVGSEADKKVPQDSFILYFWGSAYLAEHQNDKAANILSQATNLPARIPLKTAIYTSLADAYAGSKQWQKAFNTYEQTLKIDANSAITLNNYAYYLALQGKELEKAEQMALKAVKLKPGNASFLDTLGWVYYKKGEYANAQKYIKKAIDTGNASANIMEHMGDVMDKLNKPEEAKNWWRKALQKDSTRTHLKEKVSK